MMGLAHARACHWAWSSWKQLIESSVDSIDRRSASSVGGVIVVTSPSSFDHLLITTMVMGRDVQFADPGPTT